jgi:hypothetical protein
MVMDQTVGLMTKWLLYGGIFCIGNIITFSSYLLEESQSYYGHYEGWTATCYHGNSDGAANMLWVQTDGYVSLWTMDASGNPTSMSYYGPYPGLTAQDYD